MKSPPMARCKHTRDVNNRHSAEKEKDGRTREIPTPQKVENEPVVRLKEMPPRG